MRRLISLVITMTLAAAAAMADSQADFNRYIQDYNRQVAARQYGPAAKSAAAASMICAEARNYDGAFKLLSTLDHTMAEHGVKADSLPRPYFTTAKARFDLYRRMGNEAQAEAWLKKMGEIARVSNSSAVTEEMLFTEAQYYYAVGRNQLGDRCISRLIRQYETAKDYKGADTAYQQLIDKAVTTGDAKLVEHTFESYMHWSDSIEAVNADSELAKVKQEKALEEAEVARKQSTINSRTSLMVIFITLFVIAVAAFGVGIVFYQRIRSKNRRMKQMAREAEARNAAKSAMMQNMSSTIEPALDRLDPENPAVQSIKGYVRKVGELSEVDSSPEADPSSLEDVNVEQMASHLADGVRPQLKKGVTLQLEGTKGYARINRDEVEKILAHLLENAAKFTPEGGRITLAYRKRGARSLQFVVTDSGPGIPADDREKIFTAFSEAGDLMEQGDRLGLPICALRAEKMGGTLTLDPQVTCGASFILALRN